MNRYSVLLLASSCLLPTVIATGQNRQNQAVYDDFKLGYIDPSKWSVGGMCSNGAYDCAREVSKRQLRLAIRSYGAAHSNSGLLANSTSVGFANPAAVEAVTVDFTVKTFSSAGCPANPQAAHPQLGVVGTFFNTGSGSWWDDTSAFLIIEPRADDTGVAQRSLWVSGFMWNSGNFFNHVSLGTLEEGESATATLHWDRANRAFIVRIEREKTLPLIQEAAMPYSLADTNPPVNQGKTLGITTFTPNCAAAQSHSAMEVQVNRVRVHPAAAQ